MKITFLEDCPADTAEGFEKDLIFKAGKTYDLNEASAHYWMGDNKAKTFVEPKKKTRKKKK